jgi:DNA-binding GntR family transcriptional regulator
MGTQAYAPIDRLDLTDQAYEVLKDKILRRELAPGDKISVEEVARGLGVSRSPVTSALRRLASEGLVTIQPQRGTFVSGLTAKEVDEWFDIRLMIELHAADLALARGAVPELLHQLDRPIELMRRSVGQARYEDYKTFMDGDRDFHHALVRSANNDHLLRLYSELNVHIQVARAHYVNGVEEPLQVQQEHDAILAAFTTQDPDRVRQALRTHILNVKSRILELLEARGGQL